MSPSHLVPSQSPGEVLREYHTAIRLGDSVTIQKIAGERVAKSWEGNWSRFLKRDRNYKVVVPDDFANTIETVVWLPFLKIVYDSLNESDTIQLVQVIGHSNDGSQWLIESEPITEFKSQ